MAYKEGGKLRNRKLAVTFKKSLLEQRSKLYPLSSNMTVALCFSLHIPPSSLSKPLIKFHKNSQETHQKSTKISEIRSSAHIKNPPKMGETQHKTHKIFLVSNYILLGAASSCIFLTLSLRLFPSLVGFLFMLLQAITIAGAVSGCAASSSGASHRWYAFHMVATVLTAIFQGSVSVLIFTTTANFLGALKTYVREGDAAVILKLAGGLCVLMFCLEWVVMSLAFVLRYHAFVVDGGNGGNGGNGGKEEDLKNWPWPFQV